ncbi:MAG: dual specificity protein phosphatase family protein [Verrucomicrobia bacterium]|nr:dual specificity protein phosphatase family protein [Verrucomicrobiota bacterium]
MKMDAGFWNVVSIREPSVPRPVSLRHAKLVHEVIFEDREVVDPSDPGSPPRREHLADIFRFVDAHPGEPVLIHCLAGLSRSPAVALALIVRGLLTHRSQLDVQPALVEKAVTLLLKIRPKSRPNALVLLVGLEQFLTTVEAGSLVTKMLNHPVLFENRFKALPAEGGQIDK